MRIFPTPPLSTAELLNIESGPPDFNQTTCQIQGKIIYFSPLPEHCFTQYNAIIRDSHYNYHHIVLQENKEYYRDLSGTVAKEISCEGIHFDIGNNIIPKIGNSYHFVVKKYYNTDNYVIAYSTGANLEWEEQIPVCDNWTIVDRSQDIAKFQNNNFIIFGILIFFVVILLLSHKYKLFKKQ